jgi:hypothetical protein
MSQTENTTSFGSLAKRVVANDPHYDQTVLSMISSYGREILAKIGLFQYSRGKIIDIVSQPRTATAEQATLTNKSTALILDKTSPVATNDKEYIKAA